ncbi:MAG: signal peptidase I [Bacillota bacterium]|jgi:signal peptidase
MSERTPKEKKRSGAKGRKYIPALCNILGILILALVIVTAIPVAVPRLLGYEAYTIVSGSMEPEIPVGSLAYVKEIPPDDIEDGEIIAFMGEGSVVVHRVVTNHTVEGRFVTKGDANEKEDPEDVPYANYIGRLEKHYPVLGQMLIVYMTNLGRVYMLCFAACGVLLNLLAARLRRARK